MSGLIFLLFTALVGVINYQTDKLMYNIPLAPAFFIEYLIITAMLPFIATAVVSFVVYAFSAQAAKSEAKNETETQEKEMQTQEETQPETETQETASKNAAT